MKVVLTKSFIKKLRKLTHIEDKVDLKLALFIADSHSPELHNHALHGAYSGFRSINITGDYRALYEELDGVAIFSEIGTHSELYKK